MRRLLSTLKYLAVLLWSAFVALPFLWAATTSFKTANGVTGGATYLPWIQYQPSVQGWTSLFGSAGGINILRPYLNSVIVTLGASLIAMVLGTLASYGLSRYDYRAGFLRNSDIVFFFISQRILPPVVLAIPFFVLMKYLGLIDTSLGLVIVYVALLLPIAVFVMADFFDSVPRSIDEMAMLDGYNPFEAFFRVVLPNSLPGILVALLLCVVFGWNAFFLAFSLTLTQTQVLPVAIVALNSSVVPWWSLSASALISVAPLVVVAYFIERLLSRGTLGRAIL